MQMTRKYRQTRAFAVLEYVVLTLIILAAFIAFQGYIRGGFQGQYRKAGDSFGFLRQYSPTATIECAYDDKLQLWYSQACYNNGVLVCRNRTDFRECINVTKRSCLMDCE